MDTKGREKKGEAKKEVRAKWKARKGRKRGQHSIRQPFLTSSPRYVLYMVNFDRCFYSAVHAPEIFTWREGYSSGDLGDGSPLMRSRGEAPVGGLASIRVKNLGCPNPSPLSLPFPPLFLPSHSFRLPLPSSSSFPLEVGFLKYSYGVWGSTVKSPSGAWNGVPAEIEFGAFLP